MNELHFSETVTNDIMMDSTLSLALRLAPALIKHFKIAKLQLKTARISGVLPY